MRPFDMTHLPRPRVDFEFAKLPPHQALDVEIGAGQGLHAINYSKTHHSRHLLAIEKTHNRFAKLQGRALAHPGLVNLSCIHADAGSFITHCLPQRSLDRVFLLYPNPYVKNSQANLRWHNRPFISQLLAKMKPGAELVLATNLRPYADEALERFKSVWGFHAVDFNEVAPDSVPRTHFEKKYLLRGEKCWNLIFKSRA